MYRKILRLNAPIARAFSLRSTYGSLLEANLLTHDPAQEAVIARLQRLQEALKDYRPTDPPPLPSAPQKLQQMTSKPIGKDVDENEKQTPNTAARVPKGLYIYGDVGTGKSMLMDLFFESAQLPNGKKRRVHFHQFMLEVHQRIHKLKQRQLDEFGRSKHVDLSPARDAIRLVAREMAEEATLLAFDEFQVTDVADALIMTSFFGELWRCGSVVVATSNRPPSELYLNGLNRHYFLPFIESLLQRSFVHGMESSTDYRLVIAKHRIMHCYRSTDEVSRDEFLSLFRWLSHCNGDEYAKDRSVPVMMNRDINVPISHNGVAMFSFQDLCDSYVGAADYKALCDHFHTIMIYGIPRLTLQEHNQARRFVTLVDELYENRIRLVCTAETHPESLFDEVLPGNAEGALGTDLRGGPAECMQYSVRAAEIQSSVDVQSVGVDAAQHTTVLEGELASVQELGFAFRRASSRLNEMRSRDFLKSHLAQHKLSRCLTEFESEQGSPQETD